MVRARFEKWSAVVEVEFNPDLISAEQIIALFARAGRSRGLGMYRPGCPASGPFGQFVVVIK